MLRRYFGDVRSEEPLLTVDTQRNASNPSQKHLGRGSSTDLVARLDQHPARGYRFLSHSGEQLSSERGVSARKCGKLVFLLALSKRVLQYLLRKTRKWPTRRIHSPPRTFKLLQGQCWRPKLATTIKPRVILSVKARCINRANIRDFSIWRLKLATFDQSIGTYPAWRHAASNSPT